MKTSNIILTAIFVSILVWIFAVFLTAKNKMKKIIEQDPSKEQVIKLDAKDRITRLEDFNNISIKGDGFVSITQENENVATVKYNQNVETEIINKTLYVNFTGNTCEITVKKLNKLQLSEKISVEIENLKTDTFSINTIGKSELTVNNIEASYLKLKTEDKSEVHFHNINKTVPEADFEIKDKSEVTINNTRGMSISVKKGADAKYKDN